MRKSLSFDTLAEPKRGKPGDLSLLLLQLSIGKAKLAINNSKMPCVLTRQITQKGVERFFTPVTFRPVALYLLYRPSKIMRVKHVHLISLAGSRCVAATSVLPRIFILPAAFVKGRSGA